MKTKKLYTAPTSEVVDVELQSFCDLSFNGDTNAAPVDWSTESADSNDDFI